jgi:hypothetical protein
MKIIHRIAFHPKHNPKAKKRFMKLGIELKESFMHGDPKYSLGCHFDISEDDPLWHIIEPILLSERIGLNPAWAEFTRKEILSAEWVWLKPAYFDEEIYPEPQMEHKLWEKASFDYENECSVCGTGLLQKSSIRLKGEPNLKDNDFISVFWIYLIFARPRALETLTKNGVTGFEIFPVINHSSNMPLETIKQMKVINELRPGLITDNLKLADVERMTDDNNFTHEPYPCGHIKYYGTDLVMMKYKRNIFDNCPDLVRTSEWFGTGHSAIQSILASAKFVKVYMENNWKGLSLNPIELV